MLIEAGAKPVNESDALMVLGAARLGATRLIDNLEVGGY